METPWWEDYRRQKYKIRPRTTLKTMLHQALRTVFKEYVQNCSVNGVKQMTDSNWTLKKRCIWVAIFSTLFGLFCYFLFYTWVTAMSNPLILMPKYATYTIAEIDYPAVALCNVNRISMKAVKSQALAMHKEKILGNMSLKQVEDYLLNTGRLLDFSYVSNPLEHLPMHNLDIDTNKILNTMKVVLNKLAPNCKEMLLRCTWAGEVVDCMNIFRTRRTSKGHCCAFNYILKFDQHGHPNRTLKAKRQIRPGFAHGLNVIIDPMLYDYAYPINYVEGFDVLLYEPTHYADPSAGRVVHRLAEPNRVEFLELTSIKQIASPEVRKYRLSTRNCIFEDEKPDDYNDLYSYSACIVQCRVKTLLSLCQCTPYFLPIVEASGPICMLSDLSCLNKYKEKLSHFNPPSLEPHNNMDLEDGIHCPECLPDCEYTRHITKSYKTSFNVHSIDKYFSYDFLVGLNMTDKCLLSIYYSSPSGDMELLDVVSYWYQVVSSIGGLGGLLIGISIFSFVEIVYFFIIRYSQEVYKLYTE